MLPQYSRVGGGGSTSSNSLLFTRRRTREKCLIFVILLLLCLVSFGGFFYLPDNFGTDKVLKVYQQFQKAGPEIFIPAPPIAQHMISNEEDFHRLQDRAKLKAKIQEELGEILEKPDTFDKHRNNNNNNENNQENVGNDNGPKPIINPPAINQQHQSPKNGAVPPLQSSIASPLNFINGEDNDPIIRQRRNTVKNVCIF